MSLPYGLQQDQLQSIINSTNTAIGQMQALTPQVLSQGDDIATANQSASGRTMNGRIGTWGQDYNAIIAALQHLNIKVDGVLKVGMSASQESNTIANH